jgi:hypothetical protein
MPSFKIGLIYLLLFLGCPCIFIFCVLPFIVDAIEPSYNDKVIERIEFIILNQKMYHRKNLFFAKSLSELYLYENEYLEEQLKRGKKHSYQYRVLPSGVQNNLTSDSVIEAKATSPLLHSLTGVVFSFPNGYYSAAICRTDYPSQVSPSPPKRPKSVSTAIKCSEGSILVWERRG